MRWGELGISLGMAALAALFFGLATFTQNINPVDPGPAFYPRLVSALLFTAAAAQALRTWRHGRARARTPSRAGEAWMSAASRYSLGTLILSTLYVSVFSRAPYLATTTGFLIALMALAGVRRWPVLCAAAAGYAVVTYYLFGRILMVPLP